MKYKELAKQQMKGKFWYIVLAFIIVGVIEGAVSATFIGTLLVAGPLSIGLLVYLKNIIEKDAPGTALNDLFEEPFKNFVPYCILGILESLFVFLWSLLLIVPGIIKYYSYSLAELIQLENPTKKALDSITESRKLMDGHKMELFLFDLSFILWYLLGIITFGLAMIYVQPYHSLARTNYLLDLYKQVNGSVLQAEQPLVY